MFGSIAQVVGQFKRDWTQQLDEQAIGPLCRALGLAWRERVLTPAFTIRLFLLQVLWGNTACNHLPHLAQRRFTASAYCQARARLPLAIFQALLTRCTERMSAAVRDRGLWRGHRLWLLDGTSFSMPDTRELQTHYGQPGGQADGCGFPVAHCLVLLHAASGLIQKLIDTPLRTHDLSHAWRLHAELQSGDVLVGDRGFASYAHLALLSQRGVLGVMRAHQKQIVDFMPHRPHVPPGVKRSREERGQPYSRWLRSLGKNDQLVQWFKPKSRPKWMTVEQYAALPESLLVRELRYRIRPAGFRARKVTLVTTLLDAWRYPAQELALLYYRRWRIETAFAHLKTTLGMDVLRCQTVVGVQKELAMFLIVYNLVRTVMCEAAHRQGVDPERISFIDALRWLATSSSGQPLPPLFMNPRRPNRLEPRVRKRRPKEYPVMKRPRHQLRQTLRTQHLPA